MMETAANLAERLKVEGEKTLAFFQGIEQDQYERMIYTEGSQWTIRKILAHFVSAEAAFLSLIHNMKSTGKGAPEGFDIDQFNEREVEDMHTVSSPELVERFASLRVKTVELVKQVSENELSQIGRHPFFGMVTLEDMIKLIYRHNQIHQRDIRRNLASAHGADIVE